MDEAILRLNEFIPGSELVVDKTIIKAPKYKVIDVRSHYGAFILGEDYTEKYETSALIGVLKEYGVKKVVNLDGMWGTNLDRMLEKIHPYEDFIMSFGTVDLSRFESVEFEREVSRTTSDSVKKGIKGLKFWKNISLGMTDKNGKYLAIDDIRLQVIWQSASEYNIPIMLHIGDPVAFFKPVDRFNERYEELKEHPDWSFYGNGFYTFGELMEKQENLISQNPETTFIIAHVGSYSENLACVSSWLDKYPNMHIDITERISELGRQPYTSRKFFNKYKERILFGTDSTPLSLNYCNNYRFLETWDEHFDYSDREIPPQGRWKIYGIGLDDDVLEHVYFRNAERLLKIV